MNIKHIVIIRLLSISMGKYTDEQLTSDDMIDSMVDRFTKNVIPSLNNQTNLDFELICLVHQKLPQEKKEYIKDAIMRANPKFNFGFMVHDDGLTTLNNYILGLWKNYEYVILSRTDDDDFITKYAVQDTRDILKSNDGFDIISCGYDDGYRYIADTKAIFEMKTHHLDGHMSVFQSTIANTNAVEFFPKINPLCNNHTKLKLGLLHHGYDVRFIKINRPKAYIYYRHHLAQTYSCKSLREKPIVLTDDLADSLLDEFCFKKPCDTK